MFRLITRSIFAAFFTAQIVLEVTLLHFFGGKNKLKKIRATRRRWVQKLFPGIGIEVQTEGQPPVEQCILVANHRSYVDPLLLLRDVDAVPVSKSELAGWPLVGFGAKISGVILLERQNQFGGVATLRAMTAALKAGESIIIFPEGTTSAGATTLPFLKGAFQLAARYGVAVAPVALIFENEEDYWVGDDTFAAHAARRWRIPRAWVKVCYGSVLRSSDADFLLSESRSWIDARLLAG